MCGAIRAHEPVSPSTATASTDGAHNPDVEHAPNFDALLPGQQQPNAEPIVGRDASVPPPPVPSGAPRPLRSPKVPTIAERERHSLTHLPYQSWCPYCVAGKRPNSPHRRLKASLEIPMLSGDYGYFGEAQLLCFLVITVRPFGVYWACVVDKKGPTPAIVSSLSLELHYLMWPDAFYIPVGQRGFAQDLDPGRHS